MHRRAVIATFHPLAAFRQQGLGPAQPLPGVAGYDQARREGQGRADDRGGGCTAQRVRMATIPLPPALEHTAVAHAAKREVGQLSAQVLGELGGVGIASPRVNRQASGDDIRQPHGDARRAADLDLIQGIGPHRDRAAQQLIEHEPQAVDVGPAVDGGGDGPTFVDLPHGRALLGRHVVGRPAQPAGTRSFGRIGGRARWKSSSMGVPSAASRMLGGLRSRWTRPCRWAKFKASARQAPIQHTDWMYVRAEEERPDWTLAGHGERGFRPGLVQPGEPVPSAPPVDRDLRHVVGQAPEWHASQVGHAQQPQVPIGEVLDTIERHDVGMPQLGQRQVLEAIAGRDLEDDGAVGEVRLVGQEDGPRAPRPRHDSRRNSPTVSPADGNGQGTRRGRGRTAFEVDQGVASDSGAGDGCGSAYNDSDPSADRRAGLADDHPDDGLGEAGIGACKSSNQ